MSRERELWWLNPAWIVAVMGTLLVFAAYIVPESMYRTYWKTPKFFDGHAARMTLACALIFALGATVGGFRRRRAQAAVEVNWKERLPWKLIQRAFSVSFYLCVGGYAAWAAVAVSRGANLALVMGVLHGDKGASYVMKEVYLVTISGVTTLTQLDMVCMVLAVMIGVAMGWRRVALKCVILVVLALFRALMNSERLAVMELLIPGLVLFIRLAVMESRRFKGRLWPLLRAAPVVGYAGLIVVFGASEYFRSWINYYAGGDLTFWQFVSLRLLGYYVTALNNGALLVSRIDPTGAPFFTFHVMWRFPILSGIADALYPNLALASEATDPYMRYLQAEANPEFNNGGGFLLPMLDFGFVGALLYWVLTGIVCGILYRLFQEKHPAGLLLYPVIFVSVIELSRIIYWAEGRVFLPLCVLAAIAIASVYYYRRRPAAATTIAKEPEWQLSR